MFGGFGICLWLVRVADKKQKTWQKWRIITENRMVEHKSTRHPYAAISRHRRIEACKSEAKKAGVKFIKSLPVKDNIQVLDSRPPKPLSGCMIQHFRGYEIVLKDAGFDPSIAILMDFRCDQSQGIHFIYCLPLSSTRALVESTLFSTKIEPPDYYDKSIRAYLSDVIGGFTKIDREESVPFRWRCLDALIRHTREIAAMVVPFVHQVAMLSLKTGRANSARCTSG